MFQGITFVAVSTNVWCIVNTAYQVSENFPGKKLLHCLQCQHPISFSPVGYSLIAIKTRSYLLRLLFDYFSLLWKINILRKSTASETLWFSQVSLYHRLSRTLFVEEHTPDSLFHSYLVCFEKIEIKSD